jgi:hypothetical protein
MRVGRVIDATIVCTTIGDASKRDCCIRILVRLVKVDSECNRRTHSLGPRRSAVSTSSATMVRKARSCSGRMPEEESELTADTIQYGHLEGGPGAMQSVSDVICKR